MADLFRSIPLPNGLTVHIYDHSRHYYGDFHLVRLEFTCTVPLLEVYFTNRQAYEEGCRLLGDEVVYRRDVEQMGVPATEIERVREKLVHNFVDHSLPYFSTGEFPKKLVLGEVRKRQQKKAQFTTPPPAPDA